MYFVADCEWRYANSQIFILIREALKHIRTAEEKIDKAENIRKYILCNYIEQYEREHGKLGESGKPQI